MLFCLFCGLSNALAEPILYQNKRQTHPMIEWNVFVFKSCVICVNLSNGKNMHVQMRIFNSWCCGVLVNKYDCTPSFSNVQIDFAASHVERLPWPEPPTSLFRKKQSIFIISSVLSGFFIHSSLFIFLHWVT